MSLSPLGSAVGSRVNSSVAHPGAGRQWYHILYFPHIRNKHHQRASGGISRPSELGQLLAHPGDVHVYYRYIAKFTSSLRVSFVCA